VIKQNLLQNILNLKKMNKVTKRMATIAGIGMLAVIIAVGVTFVSAKNERYASSLLMRNNVEALAQTEDPDCPKVETVGGTHYVTVCDRWTDFAGAWLGIKCNAETLGPCTYTNQCWCD
jgi:hypothetical protein